MKPPLLYLLEVLFCSGLFLAFYRLVLVRRVSCVAARCYLLGAVLLSVAIPALDIPLYPARTVIYPLPLIPTSEPVLVAGPPSLDAEVAAAPLPTPAVDWPRLLRKIVMGLYLLVVLASIAVFVVRVVRIRRLRRMSRLTPCRGYMLAENPHVATPFSFLRTVFLGEGFEGRRREMVLAHEASHVRHCHSVERIVVELIRCLFWFNPFVWIAGRWLEEAQEWEADGDVLDAGYDLTEYRTVIFRQLFGYNPDITCGLNHSFTKNRFVMMTRSKERRFAFLRLGAAIPVVAGMMMLCSFTVRTVDPAAVAATPQGRSLPNLEELKPVDVLASMLSVNLGEESGKPEFGMLEYLPADESRYRVGDGGRKITDLKGTDITDWAWKHYGVQARNPMFLIDGKLYSKEEYLAWEPRFRARTGSSPAACVREEKIYAGDAMKEQLGDPTVDALVVWTTESGPCAWIRITADSIRLNGKPVTVEELKAMVRAEREKLAEAGRAGMTCILRADPGISMGPVEEVKKELRAVNALRVLYEAPGSSDVLRMLPPNPAATGAKVVELPDISARNVFSVLISNGGRIMAGPASRMELVSAKELSARIEAFIRNAADDSALPEKRLTDFDLPDGGVMQYPVSEGIVSIQTTKDTPYAVYVEAQRQITNAFHAIRREVAQQQFGRAYASLTDAERTVIDRAVPMKIFEAEQHIVRK